MEQNYIKWLENTKVLPPTGTLLKPKSGKILIRIVPIQGKIPLIYSIMYLTIEEPEIWYAAHEQSAQGIKAILLPRGVQTVIRERGIAIKEFYVNSLIVVAHPKSGRSVSVDIIS